LTLILVIDATTSLIDMNLLVKWHK
jgi:hypothetical protein